MLNSASPVFYIRVSQLNCRLSAFSLQFTVRQLGSFHLINRPPAEVIKLLNNHVVSEEMSSGNDQNHDNG